MACTGMNADDCMQEVIFHMEIMDSGHVFMVKYNILKVFIEFCCLIG